MLEVQCPTAAPAHFRVASRLYVRPLVSPFNEADSSDADFRWPHWSLDARRDPGAGSASDRRAHSRESQAGHDWGVGCRKCSHSGKLAWVRCGIRGERQRDWNRLLEAHVVLDRGS